MEKGGFGAVPAGGLPRRKPICGADGGSGQEAAALDLS